jgi:hypothetical protein
MKNSSTMPIKQEQTVLRDTTKDNQAALAKDIDNLVEKISETLRLKARQKQRVYRTSPYAIPYRLSSKCQSRDHGNACNCCSPNLKCRMKPLKTSESPHDLLQSLLREGSLIKEAVGRLYGARERKKSFHYDSDGDVDI